ncbi:MAG TPA: hypothetical protein VJ781_13280 [Pyrinomonadaceae bacterium]|jgi:hypothetical protein|nr:hypothetical protein [Pyrinomonadaceae bacterium]
MGKLKNFLLWNYSRETSVYVIFCLAIVAFIFLTPKSWFVGSGSLATRTNVVIVKVTEVSVDMSSLEKRVREITGDGMTEIVSWKETTDPSGEKVYEVEIR